MTIEELVIALGYKVEGERDLKRFERGLAQAKTNMASFAAAATKYGAIAAAAFGAGAVAFTKSVLDVGAEFENMQATLEVMEGSSEKAKASLAWVQEFAEKTPYSLQDVSAAFVRMRAYGLDPMNGSLRSVGDAAAAMGTDMMSGVEAIADAMTGENERLKGYGVTASVAGDQITYAWTQNGKQMKQTVNKDAAEIQAALMGIFDSKFAGTMDKTSATMSGVLGNLGDKWTKFLKAIGDRGFYDWAKKQFQGLLDMFDKFEKDGTLEKVATLISDTFTDIGEGIKSLFSGVTIDSLKDGIQTIMDLGKGLYDFGDAAVDVIKDINDLVNEFLGLKDGWAGLLAIGTAVGLIVNPWATAFAWLVLIVEDFKKFLDKQPSIIGEILEKFNIDPAAFRDNLGKIGQAFKDMHLDIVAGGAAAALVIGKIAKGLNRITMGVPIFRLIAIAGAVTTLIDAFKDVGSIGDFANAVKDLSLTEWGIIGIGILAMVKPIRMAVTAVKELIQGMNKLRGLAPETPGAKGPKPSSKPPGPAAGGKPLAAAETWEARLLKFGKFAKGIGWGLNVAALVELQLAVQDGIGKLMTQATSWAPPTTSNLTDLQAEIAALDEQLKGIAPPVDGGLDTGSATRLVLQQKRNRLAVQQEAVGPAFDWQEFVSTFAEKTAPLSMSAAGSATLQQITNDNSVVNINAPVSVTVAQTNANPSQIGGAVRDAVTRSGLNNTRRMGVVGSSGGAAP